MDTFFALATCAPLPHEGDTYRLHSRFAQAINLIHSDGSLLTLLRAGKGCSPAGWVLSSRVFDDLSTRISRIDRIDVKQGQLTTPDFILTARRVLNLPAPEGVLTTPDLAPFSHPTGLLGPLNLALKEAHHPLLATLSRGFSAWYQGESPDWRALIGLGPGLTPSGDDMLVGALAALQCHKALLSPRRIPLLLPDVHTLRAMTTTVSCSYLQHAAQGHFSSALVRLLRQLISGGDSTDATRALLQHGHTSGADTVVGLAAGIGWFRELQSEIQPCLTMKRSEPSSR